jgi:methionine-rich copper-binding protein CopC
MIILTQSLASDILNLIKNKIASAKIITNQATRDVIIVDKTIVDNTENNELSLNIELYRSEEISETLTEIRFFDSSNNLAFKTTNLNIDLPSSKISFIYQVKLVYSS